MEGVHPRASLDGPGWITTEEFGLGMITNWGTHHLDIAQADSRLRRTPRRAEYDVVATLRKA